MHFGEPLDDDRFVRLLRPDEAIHTVVTADVYGAGEADLAVGRALSGLPRESFSLVGAVGHDFYGTQRDGAKGFPRFTSQRAPEHYAGYLREATDTGAGPARRPHRPLTGAPSSSASTFSSSEPAAAAPRSPISSAPTATGVRDPSSRSRARRRSPRG